VEVLLMLTSFSFWKLTPFVSNAIRAERGDYKGLSKGASDPYFYVEQWKRYNGID
jgi:large subunit ribosomal protein L41